MRKKLFPFSDRRNSLVRFRFPFASPRATCLERMQSGLHTTHTYTHHCEGNWADKQHGKLNLRRLLECN